MITRRPPSRDYYNLPDDEETLEDYANSRGSEDRPVTLHRDNITLRSKLDEQDPDLWDDEEPVWVIGDISTSSDIDFDAENPRLLNLLHEGRQAGVVLSALLQGLQTGTNTINPSLWFELNRILGEGLAARERLISINYPLVKSVIKNERYHQRWLYDRYGSDNPSKGYRTKKLDLVEFRDVYQAGTQGLIDAIDRFDLNKGRSLYSHAKWWVKRRIDEMLSDCRYAVATPDDVQRIFGVVWHFECEHGRSPTPEETEDLQKQLNVSKEIFLAAISVMESGVSLNSVVYGSDVGDGPNGREIELGSLVSDEGAMQPFEVVDDRNVIDNAYELANLSKESREILALKYGDEPTFDKAIGKMLGITEDAARMRRVRALEELKLVLLSAPENKDTPHNSRSRRRGTVWMLCIPFDVYVDEKPSQTALESRLKGRGFSLQQVEVVLRMNEQRQDKCHALCAIDLTGKCHLRTALEGLYKTESGR